MTHTAFIGTGLLGGALAEAAAKRGTTVTVWNRTPSKAHALEQFGIRVAATPADAARGAKTVHLVLKDDAVVDEVIGALRPGLAHDAVIVDHSTNDPALTAERSRRLDDAGVGYLHCPVFIGPAAARKGEGTILVCGPRTLYERVREELAPMAASVRYLGERPDLAAVYKLCGNAFIIGLNALVADVLSIARAADVAPSEALGVVEVFDPAASIRGRMRKILSGDFTPSFELEMARKDVRLMLETAGDEPLAALPGVAMRMDELLREGHGADDLAVIGRGAAAK